MLLQLVSQIDTSELANVAQQRISFIPGTSLNVVPDRKLIKKLKCSRLIVINIEIGELEAKGARVASFGRGMAKEMNIMTSKTGKYMLFKTRQCMSKAP
jgi:hypothetical protein